MLKMLGALFASLFAAKAPPLPPSNAGRAGADPRALRDAVEAAAGDIGGHMIFPPMRYHRAIRNPEHVRGDDLPHYLESPHPVVPSPNARMSRIGKQLDDIAKGGGGSGKALRRKVRTLQFAASVVGNRIARHERIAERRAA